MIPPGAPILTAEAMREAEARLFRRVPQLDVMERAAEAVARETARFAMGRPVLVLAGPGNNGGDAYAAARLLAGQGLDVSVAALGDPGTAAAATMAQRWGRQVASLYETRARPVLVDGLFGTGMTRPLERGPRALLADLAKSAQFVLAIDLPSGIETDTGAHLGAPGATLTLALGALKPAHLLEAGLECCGDVMLADIGLDVDSSWRSVARPVLSAPEPLAHKYSRGMVVVVEGAMPGAARLAARAALAGGAGYVLLAGAGENGPDALVRRRIGDADDLAELLRDERVGAVVVGPGLGRDRRAEQLLKAALATRAPLVLDGDALTLLGRSAAQWVAQRTAATWLTPHSGEFDRMFGEGAWVEHAPHVRGSPGGRSDPLHGSKIERSIAAAEEAGAVVIHKGADTVIAAPSGEARVLARASSWLSTAGTGDVLAGLLGAQAASGRGGIDAAEAAVWLHGRAARLAGPAFIADALIDQVPAAIGECL